MDETTGKYFRIGISAFLMVLILVGNGLVIAAYKFNSRLRTTTYTLLVSLAISDLLVGGVTLPLWIYCGSLKNWAVSYSLRVFYLSFDIFSALASMLQLTLICLERFVAISRPFLYKTLPSWIYVSSIVSAWILAAILAGLYPVVYEIKGESPIYLKAYTLSFIFAFFIIPMIVITVMNIFIFSIVKSLSRRLPHHSSHSDSSTLDNNQQRQIGRTTRKETRTALTLALVTFLFYAAWLPFFIVALLSMFCLKTCLPTDVKQLLFLMEFIKWLQYSQSMFNPLIYTFRDREIRITFVRILLWCRKRSRVFPEVSVNSTFETNYVHPSNVPLAARNPLVLSTLRMAALLDERPPRPSITVTDCDAHAHQTQACIDYDVTSQEKNMASQILDVCAADERDTEAQQTQARTDYDVISQESSEENMFAAQSLDKCPGYLAPVTNNSDSVQSLRFRSDTL